MTKSKETNSAQEILCYHCGDICKDDSIYKEEKFFCCQSCRLVYEILDENGLCKYYELDEKPGITPSVRSKTKYEFLEDEQVKRQVLNFSDGNTGTVTFLIPQMHCSSCIWLLENMHRLDEGITYSRVDYPQKKVNIKFLEEKTSLKKIAELLDSLGYEPSINLDSTEKKIKSDHLKKLYYKIGVAGFAAGNIMLLSFPEYLGLEKLSDPEFHKLFGYLNLFLSLPVFFYSSSEYYISAYKGLKNKIINIDFPLFLGILVLFIRSLYEIILQTGAGYMDSMAGLVFLLLVGKLFQSKTYESMNFERTYKSYFPLSVTLIKSGVETTIPLSKLKIGDRILVRNNEIIPVDSILFRGDGNIDYSFVTGESAPVQKVLGEIIFAGGRQTGSLIELEVIKNVSQSYLTQLWNNDPFSKEKESSLQTFSNVISKYFTLITLILAIVGAAYWMPQSFDIALNVFTAILIVTCPCALALAIPFTFGNLMRIFGRNNFYIKNTFVIEYLSRIKSIVFDKTGTLTQNKKSEISFNGRELNEEELSMVKSLTRQSTHPLSRKLFDFLSDSAVKQVDKYAELTGKGISGYIGKNFIKLGSEEFIAESINTQENLINDNASRVYLRINETICGYFSVSNAYREGLKETISELDKDYELHLLSGDNESERYFLKSFFKDPLQMYFKQSPENKLKYIKVLQNEGQNVLMVGDGLNDAGALKQSDVGISISEDVSNFSPACDGILESEKFSKLPDILKVSKQSISIIIISFALSFIYNLLVLVIAFQGLLKPIIAAILMPVSSISVVLFSILLSNYSAKRRGFK
ncbi:MAG: heavy metal translocating P-type ATPase metal-binding domain-containing protein [Ignavibacteria bacterium]|nr:heavy metal translocating P-type ATPase metal-binding domain-containing protein [Ignavibacteria bacterium]